MKQTVSIVILTFNNLKYSKQCIESLYKYTAASIFKLILVDNGSTDGTVDWIKEISLRHANIKYILNKENKNFAGGCNQGAAIASGEYLLFLNSDTIITSDWLQPMVACFQKDKKVGIVGNKHLFPNSDIVWHCGGVIGDNKLPKHIYIGHTAKSPMVNKSREYPFVTGACLLIKKSIFEKVGGFDNGYKNSYEDVDLCFSVKNLGYKIWYCHESSIYHYGSISAGRNDFNTQNLDIFYKKFGKRLILDEGKFWEIDGYPSCLTAEYKADQYIWSLHQPINVALRNFHASLSWRITRPLRFLWELMVELKSKIVRTGSKDIK